MIVKRFSTEKTSVLVSCLNLCQISWQQSPNIKMRRAYFFYEFILYTDISFKAC